MTDRTEHRWQMIHVKLHDRFSVHKATIRLDYQWIYIESIDRFVGSHLRDFYFVIERYRTEIPQDKAATRIFQKQL